MRTIDADELREYANNMKDKSIDANDIARFPTIDPVKHGHWECEERCDEYGRGVYVIRCAKCKSKWRELCIANMTTYCPDCGAKMDEEVSE